METEGLRLREQGMRLLLLALGTSSALLNSGVVHGGEYAALKDKLIVGRCHMENCWWFRIESARKMGESQVNELFALSTKGWSANCKGSNESRCGRREFDGSDISFILCSKTHPAWIHQSDDEKNPNEWHVTRLGPGSMDASSGAGVGIHVMYWAACHKLEVSDPFDPKLGERFGYPTSLPDYLDKVAAEEPVENPFAFLNSANANSSPESEGAALKKTETSPPVEVPFVELERDCQQAISESTPDAATDLTGPDIYRDFNGDLSVGWSGRDGTFYIREDGEQSAAKKIGNACSEVVVIVYSGPTGGSERWYIRRNDFNTRHSRDSGFPGDESKYWGWDWDTVPFNYDPETRYE